MFCTKCGNEVQKDWVKCPYCGKELQADAAKDDGATEGSTEDAPLQAEGNQAVMFAEAVPRNGTGAIAQKNFLKYVLLSIVTLGIYGIYMLYTFSKDMNTLCEGDGQKSPNYIIVALLGLCTLGIYPLYWWYKQAERLKNAAPRYGTYVQESGGTIVCWQLLGGLLFGIGPYVVIYIMFDHMNRMALVYNGEKTYEEMQQMGPAHPKLIRNVAIAAGSIFAFFLVLLLGGALLGSTSRKDSTEDFLAVDTEESEEWIPEMSEEIPVDFSAMDLADFIGKSESDLENIGFEESFGGVYGAMGGDIVVMCTDGVIDTVVITGQAQEMPSFGGVRIGMEQEEAYQKLVEKFPEDVGGEGINLLDPETGGCVGCDVTDGKIATIEFTMLSVSDLNEYQEEKREAIRDEFVFPDSDNQYLTEEEVREKDADQLLIGRNEIFARHGYIFQEPEISAHFTSTSWYQGTVPAEQFQADQVFNEYEKKNVELIKKVEDEISSAAAQDAQKQAAIDAAYAFVSGKTFHRMNRQTTVEFTASGDFYINGYYGSDLPAKYCSYYFSADYGKEGDNMQAMVFLNIEGVAYYFQSFADGTFSLTGNGEFDGWYETF